MTKKLLALLLTMAFLFSTAAFAGVAEEDIVELDIIWGSWPTWDEGMDADPVGRWLTEQTGVKLNMETITGDTAERYALLLSTGDLPDFMTWAGDTIMQPFVDAGYIVALDDYLDQMPNVISMYGDNLNAIRHMGDGHLYALRNWYMGNSPSLTSTLMLNHRFMLDYMPEYADGKTEIILSDLEEAFAAYKADHPTNADGADVFPVTDSGYLLTVMQYIYGIKPLHEVSDTHVSLPVTHELYPEIITTLNRWYREGILDPEYAINKLENAQSKLSTGISIAFPEFTAQVTSVNSLLQETDPESYFMHYYISAESGKSEYLLSSSIGVASLCLTSKCENIEKAIEFMDFLCAPYTNFVVANGLQGMMWDYDADGNVVVDDSYFETMPDLWDRFRTFGGYKYIFTICEGVDTRFEGWPTDVYKPIHEGSGSAIGATNLLEGDFPFERLSTSALYDGIVWGGALDPESEEAFIETKVNDLISYALPEMIMAESEEAALARYDKLIEDLEAAGLEQYENAISEIYFPKKAVLEG